MKTNPVLWRTILGVAATLLLAQLSHAADLVWIGGTGNWNAAGNWSPAQIPTAADNVWITNNGDYTVTVPGGTTATNNSLALGGASGTQTLAVDRATLTINGPSTINPRGQLNWLVAQSIVTGPGNLAVNGTLNWANGTISGAGATTIGNTGVLSIGSGGITLGRTLNNSGAASWAGGNFTITAGNSINNQPGGTFDITADGRLSGAATTPINNSGTFRQVGGSAGTIITAPLNNSGLVQSLIATLNLNLGGTHSGNFSNLAGATVNFGGGSHALTAGSRVSGAGAVSLSGAATLSASGTFDPGTTLNVSSGVATLNSGCDVTAASVNVTGNGGIVLFNSASSVGSVALSGGTLGGTSTIRVSGPLALSGGTVSNALVFANGGLSISGNTTLNGTKLVNPATAIWSAGSFTGANGAVISNLVGAAFINTFDGNAASGTGATPLFINSGTFAKTNGTAAAGTTSIDFTFLNTGLVEVQTNTLRYAANQQTAGLTLLDGGALSAQAQPLQLLGGSLVGTGAVTVANAQNVVNSSSLSPGFPVGELDIAGNYQQTASGALHIHLGGYNPGTEFDLVTVAAGGAGGVATLAGTLNVILTNNFAPTNGSTFTFLASSSRVGAFSIFNYPSNDIGMQVSYGPTLAQVRVTNLKPVVAHPIPNPTPVTYGAAFAFQFATDSFSDPDGDTLTYSASGLPSGIAFDSATRSFSGTASQAGQFAVTVTATDNGTPSLSVTNGFVITVNPAPISVTALPQTKLYGATDPTLAFNVSGLQLGDTIAGVLSGGLSRAAGETVAGSPYAISQGTLSANTNYALNFAGSALTITPAPLSITADAKSKLYGTADPTFTTSFNGFVNGDAPASLTGTLGFTRAPGQNVGTYSITPSGLFSSNYSITFGSSLLTITRAALTVTADNKSKTYGATDPAFTTSYTGLVNGDTSANLTGTLSFSRAPGETVSNYSITPSGLSSGNYDITFNTGTLTISPTALSVTADSKNKTYGAADPAFTATFAGFVNNETPAVLGGTLTLTRISGETIGNYAITPAGLTSSNYNVSYHTGTLSIARATLTVAAATKTKTYGATDPALTFTVTGLQFTDTQTTVVSGALTRVAGETVAGSPYAISQGTLTVNSNYTLSFIGSSLSITPAPLTVVAQSKSKVFGTADPAFTVSYSGFVAGETSAGLGGTLSISRAPGEGVGTYAITPSGLTSSNYAITFVAGVMTITAPAPTITSLTRTGVAQVTLTWTSASNATYRVQFVPGLSSTNWSNLPGDILANSSTASKIDPLTASNRFYRVLVVP